MSLIPRFDELDAGFEVCAFRHGGDKEEIDELTYEEESAGEEPEEPGDPFAVVEAVDAAEADKA